MPPTRTNPTAPGQRPTPLQRPAPMKPAKSERTHEENQERAYIAASRRSDRSLEARVESARRASEIHKKRTGRALRVTENDVLNEEMYEEEEDDHIGMRHLGFFDGNRNNLHQRFMAYYSHQEQMRNIVSQHIQAQMRNTPGQGVAYSNPMMYPMQQPYAPLQQRFMPTYLPGYTPQITYVQNPTHSQGRNMSMHVPRNPTMGLAQPMMMPVGATATNSSASAPATQQHFTNSPSPATTMASRSPLETATAPNFNMLPTSGPAGLSTSTSPSGLYDLQTSPSGITNEQQIEQSTFIGSVYPFTTQPAGEALRFYQGMQMQSNDYSGNRSNSEKAEFTAKDFASLSPDPAQGWTITKGQPFPSPIMQPEDWSVSKSDSCPKDHLQEWSPDQGSSESPATSVDNWTGCKGEQLPPTPSTAGLGAQKLETSLLEEPTVSQSFVATNPVHVSTAFDDTSALPSMSGGEFDFTDGGLWSNQVFGEGEVFDEWSQLFTNGVWEQSNTA